MCMSVYTSFDVFWNKNWRNYRCNALLIYNKNGVIF